MWEFWAFTFLKQPFREPCSRNRVFNLKRDRDRTDIALNKLKFKAISLGNLEAGVLLNKLNRLTPL